MNKRGRNHRAALRWVVVTLAAAVTAGCSETDGGSANEHVVKPSEPAPFELKIVDRLGYEETISHLQGKVVLVDCWATWCLPCVEQLPHTVALVRSRARRDWPRLR